MKYVLALIVFIIFAGSAAASELEYSDRMVSQMRGLTNAGVPICTADGTVRECLVGDQNVIHSGYSPIGYGYDQLNQHLQGSIDRLESGLYPNEPTLWDHVIYYFSLFVGNGPIL